MSPYVRALVSFSFYESCSLFIYICFIAILDEQLKGLSLVVEEEDELVFNVEKNGENNANLELSLVGLFFTYKAL